MTWTVLIEHDEDSKDNQHIDCEIDKTQVVDFFKATPF